LKRNENKLNEELINAEKYKLELKGAINKENHRVNIDSAKKKAVIQRMDYDGFHQMVLGADLKGIKQKEIAQLKPESVILNSVAIAHKLCETKDIYAKNFVPLQNDEKDISEFINDKLNAMQIKEKDGLTLKIFEKNLVKNLENIEDKINYLLEISIEEFAKLFDKVFIETDLFLLILNSIANFIIEKMKINEVKNSNIQHLFNIIKYFEQNSQFKVLKKFIGKKYKALFDEVENNSLQLFDEVSLSKWDEIKIHLITNI
jgi:hypothetical protein